MCRSCIEQHPFSRIESNYVGVSFSPFTRFLPYYFYTSIQKTLCTSKRRTCPAQNPKSPSLSYRSYRSTCFPLSLARRKHACNVSTAQSIHKTSRMYPSSRRKKKKSRRIRPLGRPGPLPFPLHPHLLPEPGLEMRRRGRDELAAGGHGAADLVPIRVHCTQQLPSAINPMLYIYTLLCSDSTPLFIIMKK